MLLKAKSENSNRAIAKNFLDQLLEISNAKDNLVDIYEKQEKKMEQSQMSFKVKRDIYSSVSQYITHLESSNSNIEALIHDLEIDHQYTLREFERLLVLYPELNLGIDLCKEYYIENITKPQISCNRKITRKTIDKKINQVLDKFIVPEKFKEKYVNSIHF